MPNYTTHKDLTIISGLLTVGLIAFTPSVSDGLLFHVGVASTLIFNPDLDIHQRLGPIGKLIGLEAYKALVPHRHGLRKEHWSGGKKGKRILYPFWKLFMFSHVPFVGTLPRTLILFSPLIVLMLLFNSIESFKVGWFLWVWLGMSYSDIWHVAADIITSDFKKMSKGYWVNEESRRTSKRNKRDDGRHQREDV